MLIGPGTGYGDYGPKCSIHIKDEAIREDSIPSHSMNLMKVVQDEWDAEMVKSHDRKEMEKERENYSN